MAAGGVVFDLFGTLVEGWGPLTASAKANEIAALLGLPAADFETLLAATYTERADGTLGDTPEMLGRLSCRLGHHPSPEALARAAEHRVSQFFDVLREPRPEVHSLLAVLRDRGLRLGVITDCSAETPRVWGRLGWNAPIQAAVFSWSEGARKPAAGLYLKVAERLGLDPGECLFVGDGGSQELSGAERAGMRACQLLVPRADGDQLLQYDPDPSWSGPVVSCLSAILPRLAG